MSGNSFGHLFKFTTFGESHGPAIGVVVDGVPPNINLNEEDIQLCLDKRKPGQSRFTTQRREADQVEILSGVFERHPKLKYLISESGCAWVKGAIEHMDKLYFQIAKAGSTGEVDFQGRGVTREPPSHYARTNCWYGASFPRPADLAGRHLVGVDHVLWGADYPHFEGTYPYTLESLRLAFSELDPDEVRMIVGENAAKFFGFDMDELRASNEYLGALLYVSFLFIAFFVMLNMFLAIIARAYDESGVLHAIASSDQCLPLPPPNPEP